MLPENVNILNKTEEEPRNLTEREGLDAIEKEKDINMLSETENEESRKVYAYTHCFANTSNYRRRYGAEALSKRFKKSTAIWQKRAYSGSLEDCMKECTDMYSRCKAISYYMGLIDRFEECWTHKSVQSSDEERPVAREWVLYDGSDEDKPTEIGWTAYEMIC
jgi:hypothetical protein